MVKYASNRAAARARRAGRAEAASLVRRLDWVLVVAVGGLVLFGLWAISGITRHDVPGSPNYYVTRQAIFAVIGLLGAAVAVFVDPDVYRRSYKAIYTGTIGLMVLVFLAAPLTRGSKRWIDLGFFRFQPSEFGKLLFVLALAGFLAERSRRVGDPTTSLRTIGLATIPIFLVFVQPDLGTAMVYGAALAAILFVAGTRWTHLALLGVGAVAVAVLVLWGLPSIGQPVLKHYQQERLLHFGLPKWRSRSCW